MEQYICECQEEVEPEWVKATVEAINAQSQGEAVWLAALSSKPKGVKRMMADKVTLQVQPTTPKELYQVQREDPAIGKVIEYKQWQTTNSARRAESTTRLSIPLT